MIVADKILERDLHPTFGSKKLKYQPSVNRPQNFDVLATSLARVSGNSELREVLEKAYPKQIENTLKTIAVQLNLPRRSLNSNTPFAPQPTNGDSSNGNGSNGDSSNGNGGYETSSTDDGIRMPGDHVYDNVVRRLTTPPTVAQPGENAARAYDFVQRFRAHEQKMNELGLDTSSRGLVARHMRMTESGMFDSPEPDVDVSLAAGSPGFDYMQNVRQYL